MIGVLHLCVNVCINIKPNKYLNIFNKNILLWYEYINESI